MKIHELKTDPIPFDEVWCGHKTFEIRLNDRDYRTGDVLHLRETTHSHDRVFNGPESFAYSGREMLAKVTHILVGYGLKDGWCVLSIETIELQMA